MRLFFILVFIISPYSPVKSPTIEGPVIDIEYIMPTPYYFKYEECSLGPFYTVAGYRITVSDKNLGHVRFIFKDYQNLYSCRRIIEGDEIRVTHDKFRFPQYKIELTRIRL